MVFFVCCGWLGAHIKCYNISTNSKLSRGYFCVLSTTPPNDTYKNINGDLIYNYNVITITIIKVQRNHTIECTKKDFLGNILWGRKMKREK